MFKAGQSRKRSPSDLPDEPWVSGPMIPPAKQSTRGGRPRAVDMRAILNTIPSLNRSGGTWKMLRYNGLTKRAIYDDCGQWRDDGTWAGLVQALRERNRVDAGHEPPPSAACIDSLSVKTTEVGSPEHGDDGGDNINGHKRCRLVDIPGLLMAIVMTSVGLDDGVVAPKVLG
jgi:putative transposase